MVRASRPSRRGLPGRKEQRKKTVLFFVSLLSAALFFHGFFFFLSGFCVLSWRPVANGLILLFLTFFSLKRLFSALCSVLAWIGLWFVFLGEALFLLEYPAVFVFQESLHGALLVGGVLFVTLGFWEERQRPPYSGAEQILEEMNKPALFLDREGRIQGINRRGTELLGYDLADVRGCPFVQFLPVGDRGKAWERFQKVWDEGGRSFCFWVATKEGREILLRAVPLFSAPERGRGIIFELEDITRSRTSWLSLYREGRELREYLEAVQDVFLILDREGKIRYLNRAGSSLLGVKRREVIGKTLGHFMKGEEAERWAEIFQGFLEGKLPFGEERILPILTNRGEMRQIRWNCQALSGPAGEIRGFAFSGIDVTEEMHHWEELQSDHLFHWTLLELIYRFLREGSVALGVFSQHVATSLGAVFAAGEVYYLGRSDDGGFTTLVAVGEAQRGGEQCALAEGGLMTRDVFVAGLRWEGGILSFSLDPGLPSFLVVPLSVSEKLEGLFLVGGKKGTFTGADVQRAQIVKEILELLFFRKRTEEELLYLSSHDSLTGALNHKAFREKGGEVLALAERYQRPLSLIFLDVDDFKAINDGFGHLFGDKVLSLFAQHLRNNLRRSDLLARLGGDEFVLLLPETPGEKAWELLERLESNPLFLEEGEEVLALRFSAGVSTYPDDGQTLEALMEVADLRMYERKKTGERKQG